MIVRKNKEDTPCRALVPHSGPVREARLVRREKRFLVLVEMDGENVWIHSNNTGTMLGLLREGARVLTSKSDRPGRRLAYTQEAILSAPAGCWVGVNTLVPNRMLVNAFLADALPFATGYEELRTEVPRGTSRFDARLVGCGLPDLWIECKNVTLVEDCVALFPDAKSERGCRHLEELMDVVAAGGRAAMFYLVQRTDAGCFGPADCIDENYARLFWQAVDRGVEIHAFEGVVDTKGVRLGHPLPLVACPHAAGPIQRTDGRRSCL